MTKNMGSVDRFLRLLVAAVVAYFIWTGAIGGAVAIAASILAAVFAATSLIGFCPLYKPLGLSTCNNKG